MLIHVQGTPPNIRCRSYAMADTGVPLTLFLFLLVLHRLLSVRKSSLISNSCWVCTRMLSSVPSIVMSVAVSDFEGAKGSSLAYRVEVGRLLGSANIAFRRGGEPLTINFSFASGDAYELLLLQLCSPSDM